MGWSGEESRLLTGGSASTIDVLAPDDAEDFALADLEADVAQGPQLAADAVAVVGLADLEQGVGPAAGLGPPVRGLRAGCRRR